ncbi:MAG: tRNA lysidine(34) synthetase TilS [Candidatus Azotimanducaceae bacterium WSBS_2022_MAG_OTU7]
MRKTGFLHEKVLTETFLRYLEDQNINRLVVGLSGGIDSVVLLDLVCQFQEVPVSAIHVNHDLHARSDEYEKFCATLGVEYRVSVHCQRVAVGALGSLEARAREARYNAFEQHLVAGDLLLLAHHADDQVETILFKLFRGGRVFGLQGMPVARAIGGAVLYRPLLEIPRSDIEQYAKEHGLSWCEDPTNAEVDADRNYIRHNIVPVIDSRFPGAKKALLAGVARDEIARGKRAEQLGGKLEQVRYSPDGLSLNLLRLLPEEELVSLLTAWLDDLHLPQPSGRMLFELAGNIVGQSRIEMATNELEFRDLNNVVYVLQPLPPLSSLSALSPRMVPISFSIGDVEFPGGCLSNSLVKGRGLRASSDYTVALRSGKEKIRIGKNRDIKNVFQESHVPSWLRDRIPLIYASDELVAIAAVPSWGVSMTIADGWAAGAGEEGFDVSLALADRVLTEY